MADNFKFRHEFIYSVDFIATKRVDQLFETVPWLKHTQVWLLMDDLTNDFILISILYLFRALFTAIRVRVCCCMPVVVSVFFAEFV